MIFHCMYIPRFVYLFIFRWSLTLLLPLGCCAAMIMGVYEHLLETALSVLLGLDPEVDLLDHKIILFKFVRNRHTVFQSDLHYLTFLPTNKLGFFSPNFSSFWRSVLFKRFNLVSCQRKRRSLSPFWGGGTLVISGRPPPFLMIFAETSAP